LTVADHRALVVEGIQILSAVIEISVDEKKPFALVGDHFKVNHVMLGI
jgi:hypothetical protein